MSRFLLSSSYTKMYCSWPLTRASTLNSWGKIHLHRCPEPRCGYCGLSVVALSVIDTAKERTFSTSAEVDNPAVHPCCIFCEVCPDSLNSGLLQNVVKSPHADFFAGQEWFAV